MAVELKLVSYNIQDGIYEDLIVSNVHSLVAEGVDIFCLQETRIVKPNFIVDRLKKELGSEWHAKCFLSVDNPRLEIGLTILWKSTRVNLQGLEKIFLPKLNYVGLYDRFISSVFTPTQRGAIIATFHVNRAVLRITNLHLDFKNGIARRMSQVKYLVDHLSKNSGSHEIICGDFNTHVKNSAFKKQQNWIEQILQGEFVEAFPNLKWTFDGASVDPTRIFSPFHQFLLRLGARFYRRLDYIFLKNIKLIDAKMEKLRGSDHYPLVIKFEV